MAKISGPLMSFEARGHVGPDLVFRSGAKGPNVYRPPQTQSPRRAAVSPAQQIVRDRYTAAHEDWVALSPAEYETWAALAREDPRAVSAWNLFFAAWAPPPIPETEAEITLALGDPIDLRDLGRSPAVTPTMRHLDLAPFFTP